MKLRSRVFLQPVLESKQSKLEVGETPESAYNSWLSAITAKLRYCKRHRNTLLDFNPDESQFWPV
jgi:hypothetical protein